MVMESGFSSPKSDAFPAGLRVLVVDDDPTWLKILEKMLKKCSYEVTTCGLAREALKLLRDRKDGFDIVISDVNMPDMDGFKLLEHVGLEMDLPVIMMSVDGETSRVMKGVQHGACDYLLKPIRMKELKNIWQHVLRKRMHEVRDVECVDDRNGSDPSNDGHYGGDQTLLGKRKDVENKHDEKESTDPSSTKKARVVWTVELHQKFVKAVNQIGIVSDKVGPKKILDLMNVPWLTRENVASHLQKYRLYLSRIRKEDRTESSFGGMKNSDRCSVESSGTFTLLNSTFRQQNDVSSNHVYPGNPMPVGDIDSKPLDIDLKSSNLLPLTEHRKHFKSEKSDPRKANSTSQIGLSHSFGPTETNINYLWTAEIEPGLKSHPNLEGYFQADLLESAPHINPGPSISGSDNIALIDIPPLNVIERTLESFSESNPEAFRCVFDMPLDCMQNQSTSINKQVLLERAIQSFLLHSKSHLSNKQGLQSNIDVALHTNNSSSNQGIIGNESGFGLIGEDLMFRWLNSGESLSKDVGFDYRKGLSDFSFPEHVSEVPPPKFGLDYDLFDQGLLFS